MTETTQSGPTIASAAVADNLAAPSATRRWWQRAGSSQEQNLDAYDVTVAANAWVPIALFAVIVCAFLFRFAAADQLSSHVDEAASVLASEMVVEKGAPIFPSGTLYLQGATISYIIAPLIGTRHRQLPAICCRSVC